MTDIHSSVCLLSARREKELSVNSRHALAVPASSRLPIYVDESAVSSSWCLNEALEHGGEMKEMSVVARHLACGDLGRSLRRRPHHETSSDNTIVTYVGFRGNHMTLIATQIEVASRGGSNEPRQGGTRQASTQSSSSQLHRLGAETLEDSRCSHLTGSTKHYATMSCRSRRQPSRVQIEGRRFILRKVWVRRQESSGRSQQWVDDNPEAKERCCT